MPVKLCVIAWKNHLPLFLRAANKLDWLEIKTFANTRLVDDPEKLSEAIEVLKIRTWPFSTVPRKAFGM